MRGFGEKETAALAKLLDAGVILNGAGGEAGFEAEGLLGAPQTDLTQRSAASGDLGICLSWAAVGQTGLATGLIVIPLAGFGAVGVVTAGVLDWIPTHTVTEPEYMADPWDTPELADPPVEQAIATGVSTNTRTEVISKLEMVAANFEVIDIQKR